MLRSFTEKYRNWLMCVIATVAICVWPVCELSYMAYYSTTLVELDLSQQYIPTESRALDNNPRGKFKEWPDWLSFSFKYMACNILPLLSGIYHFRRGSRMPQKRYQLSLGELLFLCLELGLIGSLPFLIKPNFERVSIITVSISGKCSKEDLGDIASHLPSDVAFKLIPMEMRKKEGVCESMVMTNCEILARKADSLSCGLMLTMRFNPYADMEKRQLIIGFYLDYLHSLVWQRLRQYPEWDNFSNARKSRGTLGRFFQSTWEDYEALFWNRFEESVPVVSKNSSRNIKRLI